MRNLFLSTLVAVFLLGRPGDAVTKKNFVYKVLAMNSTVRNIPVNSSTEYILQYEVMRLAMNSTVRNIPVNSSTEYILQYEQGDKICKPAIENYTKWKLDVEINNTMSALENRSLGAYPAGLPVYIQVNTSEYVDYDKYPLFITVSQQSTSASWQLPMIEESEYSVDTFTGLSRALCPPHTDDEANWPLVHLSSESPNTISVNITATIVDDFYLQLNEEKYGYVSGNRPKYYAFRFYSDKENDTVSKSTEGADLVSVSMPKFKSPKTVILMLESDDVSCMTVSVQNLSCPIYDENKDVKHRGDYFTMLNKGGITISQARYPDGFYVVLLYKLSNTECVTQSKMTDPTPVKKPIEPIQTSGKTVRIKVVETISYSDYAVAASAMLGALAVVVTGVMIASLVGKFYVTDDYSISVVDAEELNRNENTREGTSELRSNIDSDITRADSEPLLNGTEAPDKITLVLLSRQSIAALKSRSDKYLYGVLIISVFYSLPVIQLIVTYQAMLQETGNQDLCYYNFLCAHPLGLLSDFNHVFSNVGYVTLGAAFTVLVRHRQNRYRRTPQLQNVGIPQHFGMYYAMGFSLVVEGVLSASYHFCPNKMNFQFDSSFMYVMAVLILVKLYQNRHPDINASAHATFGVLACVIMIGSSEVLFSYVSLADYGKYWIVLVCCKTLFFLYVSCCIYYMGLWNISHVLPAVKRFCRELPACNYSLRPAHPPRLLMVLIFNAANIALDSYGLYMGVRGRRDIPVHILQVLLMNAVLYTAMYIAMKLLRSERLGWTPAALVLASNALWALSIYLFVEGRTKWAWTPAESRGRNAPCSLLQFYDTHDGWHLASAGAMFFSFLLLLLIDDDIAHTSRDKIAVF